MRDFFERYWKLEFAKSYFLGLGALFGLFAAFFNIPVPLCSGSTLSTNQSFGNIQLKFSLYPEHPVRDHEA